MIHEFLNKADLWFDTHPDAILWTMLPLAFVLIVLWFLSEKGDESDE